MSRRIPPEKTTIQNSTNPSLLARGLWCPMHNLEAILNCFPPKTNLWTIICVAATFPKFGIKRRKRELAMEICLSSGQLPQSTKCNPSKTRCIKNFDVNDETRFGNHNIWLLHSQPGKQGQECHFQPFTSLNGTADKDEKQDHETQSCVPTSTPLAKNFTQNSWIHFKATFASTLVF